MERHRKGSNSNEEEAAISTRKESEDKNYPELGDVHTCVICLEVVKNAALIDSCAHKFCYECLKKWVKNTPVCPLCKEEITIIMESAHEDTNINDWNKKEQASFSGKRSKIQTLSNSSSPEYYSASDSLVYTSSPETSIIYSPSPESSNCSPPPEPLNCSPPPAPYINVSFCSSPEYYATSESLYYSSSPESSNCSPPPAPNFCSSPEYYAASESLDYSSSPETSIIYSPSPESNCSPPPAPYINELSPDGSEYYDGAEQYFNNTDLRARYNVRPVYYQNRDIPLNIASFRHGCGTDSLSHAPVINSLNFDPVMQSLSYEQAVESSYAQVIANEEIPMIDLVSDNEEIPVIDLSSDDEIIDLTSDD